MVQRGVRGGLRSLGQHLRRHVHADHATRGTDEAARDQAVDTCARADVDYVLALLDLAQAERVTGAREGLDRASGTASNSASS